MSQSEQSTVDRQLKILSPPKNAPAIPEIPESAYKLDANELKMLYQSTLERREKLESRPLKTQKMRDAEDQERMKKYPRTTTRVRMPDYTIVQAVFQSKETVSQLYDFIRTLLETPERKFVLCLPPRKKLTDPSLTLYKAGLSPASNVLFGWIENGEQNGNGLKQEYLSMKEEMPMPSPEPRANEGPSLQSEKKSSSSSSSSSSSKGVPKWLQKGLFKNK
ncbi:hypothetical protein RMCBS344292_16791 [Rhizopus microsporus]|nr:hypothetical protein RMCBS344292_16791 [Rhizopus microsporus]